MILIISFDSYWRHQYLFVNRKKLEKKQKLSHLRKNVESLVNKEKFLLEKRFTKTTREHNDMQLEDEIEEAENNLSNQAAIQGQSSLKPINDDEYDSDDDDKPSAIDLARSMETHSRITSNHLDMIKTSNDTKDNGKKRHTWIQEVGYLIVIISVLVIYPIVLIPQYQSESTSDTMRVMVNIYFFYFFYKTFKSLFLIKIFLNKDLLFYSSFITRNNFIIFTY